MNEIYRMLWFLVHKLYKAINEITMSILVCQRGYKAKNFLYIIAVLLALWSYFSYLKTMY